MMPGTDPASLMLADTKMPDPKKFGGSFKRAMHARAKHKMPLGADVDDLLLLAAAYLDLAESMEQSVAIGRLRHIHEKLEERKAAL